MHRDHDRYKVLTRRAAMLAGGKVLLVSALAGRLYYLQVVESDRYVLLAEENRINLRLLPPPRGRIVDRFGEPLAVNRQNYRVLVVAEQARDVGQILEAVGRVVPLSDYDHQRVLKEAGRKRAFVPITVKENLSWQEVSRIEVNAPDLPGVIIEVGQTRFYPHRHRVAHLLGYVGAVSESELTGEPLLELPDFRIGKNGIEKQYELALRGTAGTSQLEVNAVGRVIQELERDDGMPGQEIALTIDIELQEFAAQRLQGESGAVVALDIHTGEVLALVSSPSYDPNGFTEGLSTADWRALSSDPRAPLSNKAVAGQYAPGSTFKLMVALAALESGVIGAGHRAFCPGHLELGDSRFHCWRRHGHGWMDMISAIEQSCDVFFYDVALRVGVDRIAEMCERFGLGQALGLDVPGESRGLIPTKAWKLATTGTPWQKGETAVTGIGQGFVLTTPLQLAVMTARLVNGGFAVTPHCARDSIEADQVSPRTRKPVAPIGVSARSLAVMRQGMVAVVNSKRGTARGVRIKAPLYAMGGKTGTSQVRRISKREREQGVRKNEDLEWRSRDHALFIGFAPVDEPRYAVAVVVEHGGGGSKVAAPIARDVLLETQRRDPSGTSPTAGITPARPPADNGDAG